MLPFRRPTWRAVIQTTDTAGPPIALRWFAVYTLKEPRTYQLTSTFKF